MVVAKRNIPITTFQKNNRELVAEAEVFMLNLVERIMITDSTKSSVRERNHFSQILNDTNQFLSRIEEWKKLSLVGGE